MIEKVDSAAFDDAAVDRFAMVAKARLERNRAEGRDAWQDPGLCPEEQLAKRLVHLMSTSEPSTFLDIAIMAMKLHDRGADPDAVLSVIFGGVREPA